VASVLRLSVNQLDDDVDECGAGDERREGDCAADQELNYDHDGDVDHVYLQCLEGGRVGAFASPTDLVCRDDFFYDFLEGFVEEVRICKSDVYIVMAHGVPRTSISGVILPVCESFPGALAGEAAISCV
jgi:hypothetical protein